MSNIIEITEEGRKFLDKICELSGETIVLCEQCGTCSGGCPMADEMDITPSQIMRMVMLGQTDVLDTKAVWLCASCFTCTVRCPRGLDLSKVAEALKQVILRRAVDKVNVDDLSKEDLDRLPQIALVSCFRKMTG